MLSSNPERANFMAHSTVMRIRIYALIDTTLRWISIYVARVAIALIFRLVFHESRISDRIHGNLVWFSGSSCCFMVSNSTENAISWHGITFSMSGWGLYGNQTSKHEQHMMNIFWVTVMFGMKFIRFKSWHDKYILSHCNIQNERFLN